MTSASVAWLKNVGPKLWPTVTDVVQTAPNQLSLKRRSSVGLTALELQLTADWLESPEFPFSLHTLKAPPPDDGTAQVSGKNESTSEPRSGKR